jgi:hypothetical protein
MTTTTHAERRTHHDGTRAWAWVVLLAAVVEVVAPALTFNGPGESPGSGAGPELLITPVGWAFSIWGVIYTLAVAQAVAVLVVGAHAVPRRLQVSLTVLYLGGAVWIAMAAIGSSLATASALLVMFVAALVAVLTVARAALEPRWLAVLLRASVGLYAGWVTAAFFLNVSNALVENTDLRAGQVGWQLVILAVAVATLLVVLTQVGGLVAYAAAGTWALVGIAVTGSSDGTPGVLWSALVAAAVLVAATVALQARSRTARAPAG